MAVKKIVNVEASFSSSYIAYGINYKGKKVKSKLTQKEGKIIQDFGDRVQVRYADKSEEINDKDDLELISFISKFLAQIIAQFLSKLIK